MRKAKLPSRALGQEAAGDAERAAGPGGDGCEGDEAAEGEQAGGFGEADAGAEMAGGGAEDAAAEGEVQRAEALDLQGDGGGSGAGADGAAAATDGFAGEEELGEEAAELELPAGFVFAGELGEVGEGLVEAGVEVAELR